MLKIFKLLFFIILAALVLLFAFSIYDRQFRLANIKGDWIAVSPQTINDQHKMFLDEVFSQPFHYLDRGKQSFVFESQDQQYILKFFDARCLRSGAFPLLGFISKEHCEKKIAKHFKSYQIALNDQQNDAGLLFVQLAPNSSYELPIQVIDRFSIKHEIDLSKVPFVLQQKATPLRILITHLLEEGKVDEVKKKYQQIIDLYLNGYANGILDLDHNFMYNTGFIHEQPIRIDVGRLQKNPKYKKPEFYEKDLEKIALRAKSWLDRHFPKYSQEIVENIYQKIDKVKNPKAP